MYNLPGYFTGSLVFLFGLIVGSFLNVVIHRLPRQESIVFPGSHCPSCNQPVRPYDNIPVVSYLLLAGRCRACRVKISPVYPAVELLVATLYLALFLRNGLSMKFAAELVFVSLIVPLVFIDLRHKILPNLITYPGFFAMVLLRLAVPDPDVLGSTRSLFGLEGWGDGAVSLVGSVLGALAGGGSLWLVREVYYRLRHAEGMGLGDVKMMLMVGAFLGWQLTLVTIFMATVLGSIVGIAIIKIRGATLKLEIPFGVFLGPASLIAMFVGRELITWYLGQFK